MLGVHVDFEKVFVAGARVAAVAVVNGAANRNAVLARAIVAAVRRRRAEAFNVHPFR